MPMVSVIVPVYNMEESLWRCLDSLVKQTLEDIEIIVVNDGSTDGSQAIIDEYTRKYPDVIKAYAKQNGGVSCTRNFGVERAAGRYLAFLDSDDYVDYDCYERMVRKAEKTGADVVVAPVTYVWNRTVDKRYFNKRKFGKSALDEPYILDRSDSVAFNKLYRMQFWRDNGFKFDNQWFEDVRLIYNVLLTANKVECVNIPFYHYVKTRDESITNQVDERIFDVFKSADSIIGYYKERGAYDKLRKTVELLCMRHIFWRLDTLRKSDDKQMARRFAQATVAYMDSNFPEWTENDFLATPKNASYAASYLLSLRRDRARLVDYVCGESEEYWRGLREAWALDQQAKDERARHAALKPGAHSADAAGFEAKPSAEDQETQEGIHRYGPWLIHDVQAALATCGIKSFVDFDTCRGIVAYGRLLRAATDVKIGAIANDEERQRARIALERLGYHVQRSYVCEGRVVKEHYTLGDFRIDLSYYEATDEYLRTWLPYPKPGGKGADNARFYAEMTYSPLKGVQEVTVKGVTVAVPLAPETLLYEKYGTDWRSEGPGWVYWESPAARVLEEPGYCMVVSYTKIKMRTRETPQPVLFFDREDAPVSWDDVHRAADMGYDPVVIGWSKKAKKLKRHPRVRYYIDDGTAPDFVERIRFRTCGDGELVEFESLEEAVKARQ